MDATIIDWDGQYLPDELRRLPPGRYVVEAAPDDSTAEERAGLAIGLDELDAGDEIDIDDALRTILGAPPTP
jgi:hypothetical protein